MTNAFHGLGLDVLKLIALLAMVYDHAFKALLHDPTHSTLLGRIAFPIFLMAFLWALPGLLERGTGALRRMTWRWLPPALLAQYPFQVMLVPAHGIPGGNANILITFLMLLGLAWCLHQGWVIRSLIMVILTSGASWNASYAFIGPLAVLIFMGMRAPSEQAYRAVQAVSRVVAWGGLGAMVLFWMIFVPTGWTTTEVVMMMSIPWAVMVIANHRLRRDGSAQPPAEVTPETWGWGLIMLLMGWLIALEHGLMHAILMLGGMSMLLWLGAALPVTKTRLLPSGFLPWMYAVHLWALLMLVNMSIMH